MKQISPEHAYRILREWAPELDELPDAALVELAARLGIKIDPIATRIIHERALLMRVAC